MSDLSWAEPTKQDEQGSKKWLDWRNKGIGSSDIPVIMGVSPWKNPYQLWLEKTNQAEPFQGNWATNRGKQLEPEAREWYNKKHQTSMVPDIGEHPKHKQFRASFDGVDHHLQKLIEVKFAGKVDHQTALTKNIPEKYIYQCQWLLMVSGYTNLDYVSSDGETEPVVVPVVACPIIQAQMIEKALRFWEFVQTKTPPPTEEVQVDEEELHLYLTLFQQITDEIRALDIKKEETRLRIKNKMQAEKIVCGDFKVQWIERKGNVDYGSVPELSGVNLEPYRKAPIRFLEIKKRKEK